MARTGIWLSTAWQVVTSNLWAFVAVAFIYLLVIGLVSGVSDGALAPFIIGPAWASGLAVALHRVQTGRMDLNRVQDGFCVFLPAMLIGLLVSLAAAVGYVFLFVPGLLVLALYLFPLLLVVDRRMGFWDAMEESRKRVQHDIVGFLGFVLALIGINILGAACLGVGLFVSLPVSWCAIALAYRELWAEGRAPSAAHPSAPQGCPACDSP
jgi:hypothetical protein